MSSEINVNGMRIRVDGNSVSINGVSQNTNSKDVLKDTTIKGNYSGDLSISGDNVTLVVEGNITGDITGNCKIQCKGRIIGDVTGNCIFG